MVDSITIWLSNEHYSQQQLDNLIHSLKAKRSITNSETGEVRLNGKYNGFRVWILNNAVKFVGSLSTYYYGNNAIDLTLENLERALDKLKRECPVPILRGDLWRLDIAECIQLSQPFSAYANSLLESPGYDMGRSINSVRYTKRNLVFTIYNKTNDAMEVPAYKKLLEDGKAACVLRIELRFMKLVRQQVMPNQKCLKVVQLYSCNLKAKLANAWMSHYAAISKRAVFKAAKLPSGKKDTLTFFTAYGLYAYGYDRAMKFIDDSALLRGWKPNRKSETKNACKKLCKSPDYTQTTEPIRELSAKIERSEIKKASAARL
jgi:hypothetical protein